MPGPQDQTFLLSTQPGIKRDGTVIDGNFYSDGQWVRFQRGRPKKVKGYRRILNTLDGSPTKVLVWSRQDLNAIYSFSSDKIEMSLVDNNGVGSGVTNRTPSGYTAASNVIWTAATQYDDAANSTGTIILAHASSSASNIDDATATKPYYGLADGSAAFQTLTDAPSVAGGIFSAAPYTIVYGSDGLVAWSDVNQPQVWATSSSPGDAGTDRVSGSKVVAGLPLKSGAGPAALLWSLDSVIRMEYIGGNQIFRFSTPSDQSSILAQNSVIEYDGVYYWIGVDRFMMFDSSVRELPNFMNQNYFFDNLNYPYRQKIWATKVPRFGEIWWFYPRDEETECSNVIIYNVREKTWYDLELARGAGFYSQVLHFPVMSGNFVEEDTPVTYANQTWTRVTVTATVTRISHGLTTGDTINVSVTSSAAAITTGTKTITVLTANTFSFTCLNAGDASGTLSFDGIVQTYGLYAHEQGTDAVVGDSQVGITSSFTTSNFGYPTGGTQDGMAGVDNWTRLTRVEPDFVQSGDMTCEVIGYEYANGPADTVTTTYSFGVDDGKIDMREQHRYIQLKFQSDVAGGDYETGKILIHTELGDLRS